MKQIRANKSTQSSRTPKNRFAKYFKYRCTLVKDSIIVLAITRSTKVYKNARSEYRLCKPGSKKDAIDFLKQLSKFLRLKELKVLDKKLRAIVISKASKGFRNRSSEDAIKMVKKLLELRNNQTWKNANEKERSILTEQFAHLIGLKPYEYAKKHVETVLKMMENGINVQTGYINAIHWQEEMLRDVINEYTLAVCAEQFNSLKNFPEIIKDIVLMNPEGGIACAQEIFQYITQDQFLTLFSKLAEVNPELVELISKQLEPVWKMQERQPTNLIDRILSEL